MLVLVLTSKKRVETFFDLSSLPKHLELRFLEHGADEEILALGREADFIFADAVQPVTRRVIEGMRNLKLIHSEGVGFNFIDLEAARERGVFVCNCAAVNSNAVAEHAVLLMLSLLRRVREGDALVRAGRQMDAKGRFILEGLKELGHCRIGLLGFGAIGQATASLLTAFGSEVVYWAPHRRSRETEERCHAAYMEREELFSSVDILSLHLPVTQETENSINARVFDKMKQGALLINTARGDVVQQEDLCAALRSGKLGGAGLDTLSPEPVTSDNPLLNLPDSCRYKVLFTPHIGGTTADALRAMHAGVWHNILAVSKGEMPRNIVNGVTKGESSL